MANRVIFDKIRMSEPYKILEVNFVKEILADDGPPICERHFFYFFPGNDETHVREQVELNLRNMHLPDGSVVDFGVIPDDVWANVSAAISQYHTPEIVAAWAAKSAK